MLVLVLVYYNGGGGWLKSLVAEQKVLVARLDFLEDFGDELLLNGRLSDVVEANLDAFIPYLIGDVG